MNTWRKVLRGSGQLSLLTMVSGLLSCSPLYGPHGFRLMNRRDHALTLWIQRTTECAEDADLGDEAVYEDPERVTIKAQEVIELSTSSSWYSGNNEPRCGAAWISSDEYGLDLVLAWDHEPYWGASEKPARYSVIFEGPRDRLVMHVPEEIDELPAPR